MEAGAEAKLADDDATVQDDRQYGALMALRLALLLPGVRPQTIRDSPFAFCNLAEYGAIRVSLGVNNEPMPEQGEKIKKVMPRFVSAACPTISGIRDLQENPFRHYVYIALEVGPVCFLHKGSWWKTQWHHHVSLAYLTIREDLNLKAFEKKLNATLQAWLRSRLNPLHRPYNDEDLLHLRRVVVREGTWHTAREVVNCDVGSIPPCILRQLSEQGIINFLSGSSGPPRDDPPDVILEGLMEGHMKANERWRKAHLWEREVRQPKEALVTAGLVECSIKPGSNKITRISEIRSCLGYLAIKLVSMGAQGPPCKLSPYCGVLDEERWHITLAWEESELIPCLPITERALFKNQRVTAPGDALWHAPMIAATDTHFRAPLRQLPLEIREINEITGDRFPRIRACLGKCCTCKVCWCCLTSAAGPELSLLR